MINNYTLHNSNASKVQFKI